MRTTLDLNDALLTRAKVAAARQGTTLTRLVERGLAQVLAQVLAQEQVDPADRPRPALRWIPYTGGGGMRPGVDPTSNASLYASLYAASEEAYDRRKAGLPPRPGDEDLDGIDGGPDGR